jgi:hypothetical protein
MTEIVDDMIEACREVEPPDVEALLTGDEPGLRLAGVAYLNARPDPAWVPLLASMALSEDKPFNEYWALLTLRRLLRDDCSALTASLRLRLQERLRELPPGDDRRGLVQAILTDCA